MFRVAVLLRFFLVPNAEPVRSMPPPSSEAAQIVSFRSMRNKENV
jgi:hypothetical protein